MWRTVRGSETVNEDTISSVNAEIVCQWDLGGRIGISVWVEFEERRQFRFAIFA